jgi:hypothetical protein
MHSLSSSDYPVSLRLYHGTSTAAWESIRQTGLRRPFLTDRRDIAAYYAECAADEDGSHPIILVCSVSPDSLRPDWVAYDEPLTLFREDYAASDAEWFDGCESGDIPTPDSADDWMTALTVVHSVRCLGDVVPQGVETE